MDGGEYSVQGQKKVVCGPTVVLPSACVHHNFERAWVPFYLLFCVRLMGGGVTRVNLFTFRGNCE